MAGSLIDTLSGDFDPSEYKDGYREALNAVIEAKVEGREVVQPSQDQPTSGTVVDLMAALRASVEAAKGRTADSDPAPAKKAPATKRAAKAPAKKAPAKAPAQAAAKAAAKAPAKKAGRKSA